MNIRSLFPEQAQTDRQGETDIRVSLLPNSPVTPNKISGHETSCPAGLSHQAAVSTQACHVLCLIHFDFT
jgi:hypothetical protein